MPAVRSIAVCAFLLAGCATTAPGAPSESRLENAARGAGKGATVCLAPTVLGLYFGPIGLYVGLHITLACLPFGMLGGALSGAFPTTEPL